jgi:hypothetical protein
VAWRGAVAGDQADEARRGPFAEGAIHAGGGRRTDAFAGWCGQLTLGWLILDRGDCQPKGALERTHRVVHGNFEAGGLFANALDFQLQLDRWSNKINARLHRSTRAMVSERLEAERREMRPLPAGLPDCAFGMPRAGLQGSAHGVSQLMWRSDGVRAAL